MNSQSTKIPPNKRDRPLLPGVTVPRRGLSVVELLVVIAIIAVLAAILLPTISSVRTKAHSATCVSNLRQLSNALMLYTNDHEGRLPGPIFTDQGPFYNQDRRRLPNHLQPYLAIPLARSWSTSIPSLEQAPIFACPAWYDAANSEQIYSLQANQWVKHPDHSGTFSPWGAGDPSGTGKIEDMNPPPMYMTQLMAMGIPLSETWFLIEMDHQLPRVTNLLRSVEKPVHGTYRNAIFMDGHVGRVEVNDS